jgi:5-methylcytosine-specific restriction endonuclease McrA
MDSKNKSKFRRSKIWKEFRKLMLLKQPTCEICGQKGIIIHHKFKDDYTLLKPERCLVLCRNCHTFFHRKINRIENIISNIFKIRNYWV